MCVAWRRSCSLLLPCVAASRGSIKGWGCETPTGVNGLSFLFKAGKAPGPISVSRVVLMISTLLASVGVSLVGRAGPLGVRCCSGALFSGALAGACGQSSRSQLLRWLAASSDLRHGKVAGVRARRSIVQRIRGDRRRLPDFSLCYGNAAG